MRPAALVTLHRIDEAIVKLMTARLDLREAGCAAAARELTRVIESAESARAHAVRHYERRPGITASERRLVCDLLRGLIESQQGLDGASDDPDGASLAKCALAKLRSGVDSLHGSHYMSDNNDSGTQATRDASHAGQKRQDSRSLVHHAG
jgi:hypothetical protein